jgi:hypothetical protein
VVQVETLWTGFCACDKEMHQACSSSAADVQQAVDDIASIIAQLKGTSVRTDMATLVSARVVTSQLPCHVVAKMDEVAMHAVHTCSVAMWFSVKHDKPATDMQAKKNLEYGLARLKQAAEDTQQTQAQAVSHGLTTLSAMLAPVLGEHAMPPALVKAADACDRCATRAWGGSLTQHSPCLCWLL